MTMNAQRTDKDQKVYQPGDFFPDLKVAEKPNNPDRLMAMRNGMAVFAASCRGWDNRGGKTSNRAKYQRH